MDVDADVNLDPVEAIVGDIDVDTDAGIDLLSPGADTSQGGVDEDLVVDADLDVAGVDVLDVDLDVNLDPVEEIAGDIDLGVDADADLLAEGGDATDSDVTDALSMVGNDESAGSEESGSGLGELSFDDGDTAESENDAPVDNEDGDILPDPSGSVLEGLNGVICDDGGAGLEGSFLG